MPVRWPRHIRLGDRSPRLDFSSAPSWHGAAARPRSSDSPLHSGMPTHEAVWTCKDCGTKHSLFYGVESGRQRSGIKDTIRRRCIACNATLMDDEQDDVEWSMLLRYDDSEADALRKRVRRTRARERLRDRVLPRFINVSVRPGA